MKLLKLFFVLLFFTAMNLSCSKPVNDSLGPRGNYVSDIDMERSSSIEQQNSKVKFRNALVRSEVIEDLSVKQDSVFAFTEPNRH